MPNLASLRGVSRRTGAVSMLVLFSALGLQAPRCGAATDSETDASRERALAAEAFMSQKLWLWQKRLNLREWNLTVKLVRATELKPKTLGNIHWDADKMAATIRVLHPVDYRLGFPEMLEDMEFTIVHELIHLQLSSLPRSEASRRAEERAVNHITDALLKLDRRP